MKKIFTLAVALFTCAAAFSQAGTLDYSFSGDGKRITDMGAGKNDEAQGLAIQSDGKSVVVGYAFHGSTIDFAMARYNTNGTLDTTFGNGGKVFTDFGSDDHAYAVAIQFATGKIVVAGYMRSPFGDYNFAVARYHSNGALDNTFSGDGKAIADFGGDNDKARSVAIQSDGKIVVAGYTDFLETFVGYDFAIARFNTNGTLDNTFGGGDGKTTSDFAQHDDLAFSVALQSTGKIVVGGTAVVNNQADFALVRFTTTGSVDNTFGGGDGHVHTDFGSGSDDGLSAIAIKRSISDKIIAVGSRYVLHTNVENWALAQYNANGTLDDTFSGDGKVLTDFGANGSLSESALSVAIQNDGKIVAAGYTLPVFNDYYFYDIALARYNTNGSLDNTFGASHNGKVTTDFSGHSRDEARAVAIQPNGKIVVAGTTAINGFDFAMARYHGDNVAPEAIATNSPAESNIAEKNSSAHIFPNPVTNILRIEGLDPSSLNIVSITNLSGTVFQKAEVKSSEHTFDVSRLKPGVYAVNIFRDGESTTIKIVKQ